MDNVYISILLYSSCLSGKLKVDVANGGLVAQLPVEISTAMHLADVKVAMITEAGIPVALRAQVSAANKLNGTVKFAVKMPKKAVPTHVEVLSDLNNK